MTRIRADLDTLQQVRVVLAEAMQRGLDAAESLDRAGLLFHAALAVSVRAEAIQHCADIVDVVTVEQLARELSQRQAQTGLDMKRQIVAFLRRVAQI